MVFEYLWYIGYFYVVELYMVGLFIYRIQNCILLFYVIIEVDNGYFFFFMGDCWLYILCIGGLVFGQDWNLNYFFWQMVY